MGFALGNSRRRRAIFDCRFLLSSQLGYNIPTYPVLAVLATMCPSVATRGRTESSEKTLMCRKVKTHKVGGSGRKHIYRTGDGGTVWLFAGTQERVLTIVAVNSSVN